MRTGSYEQKVVAHDVESWRGPARSGTGGGGPGRIRQAELGGLSSRKDVSMQEETVSCMKQETSEQSKSESDGSCRKSSTGRARTSGQGRATRCSVSLRDAVHNDRLVDHRKSIFLPMGIVGLARSSRW